MDFTSCRTWVGWIRSLKRYVIRKVYQLIKVNPTTPA